MQTIISLWIFSLFAVSCTSAGISGNKSQFSVDAYVTRLNGPDFEVSYKLSQPVKRLVFSHQGKPFRKETFHSPDSNLKIEVAGGKEFISRKDGAFFDSASFRFQPYSGELPQEYRFSIAFSDGSVALYSAYLAVEAEQNKDSLLTFHFTPAPSEPLILNSKASQASQLWRPSAEFSETYVYFGAIRPNETGSLMAIADPAVPSWVRQITATYLGALFHFYETQLAFRPNPAPTLFVTAADFGKNQDSFQGSSGVAWIHLGLIGKKWLQFSGERKERFLYFIAHEGFHQFQGPSATNFMDVAWIIEGSAEYFADSAMKELGWINADRLRQKTAESANNCARQLKAHPTALSPLDPKANFKITYSCGRLVHQAVDSLLINKGGFTQFWKELLARAERRGPIGEKPIDADIYFSSLRQAGISEVSIRELQKFVFTKQSDSIESISSILRLAGLSFRLEPDPKEKQSKVFVL